MKKRSAAYEAIANMSDEFVLLEIAHNQNTQMTNAPTTPQWQYASANLAELFAEMAKRQREGVSK